jgi:hypothetical protein
MEADLNRKRWNTASATIVRFLDVAAQRLGEERIAPYRIPLAA